MPWREQLRPASFRGAAFEVDSASFEGGRRLHVHEFPGRDEPHPEDLGRKARRFSVEAILIGEEYFAARDALLAALEEAGPAKLVHPYHGERLVAVESFRQMESTREGGMARVSIVFVEAGALPAPPPIADTPSLLVSAADAAEAAAAAEFGLSFSTAGAPGFVEDAAKADGYSLLDTIEGAAGIVGSAADFATDLQRAIDDAVSGTVGVVQSFTDPLATLVRSPFNMAAGILGGMTRLRAIADDPLQALGLYESLFGASAPPPNPDENTPSRRRQAANRRAIEQLVRVGAVAGAARAMAEATFPSSDDAAGARNRLLAGLETVLLAAGDDYLALADLRAAVIRDARARGASLPALRLYVPPLTLPALVIAHRLYGDATRDEEIVTRNRIPHPGFVPGGVPLEVING